MSESTIQKFRTATHQERLALMRNPEMGGPNELIQKIFDPDDQTLGISLDQRKELVFAFLTNPEVVRRSHLSDADFRYPGGLELRWNYQEHFAALWRLAAKWPKDPPRGVRIIDPVYQYIGAPDKNEIAAAIRDADRLALWALASNETVSVSDLRKVQSRLIQLGEDKEIANRGTVRRKENRDGAGYPEITQRIWSEAKSLLMFLSVLAAASLLLRLLGSGPWLGISGKPDTQDVLLWFGALGLVAVTRVIVSCTKAVLAGLREVQQELAQQPLEHRWG